MGSSVYKMALFFKRFLPELIGSISIFLLLAFVLAVLLNTVLRYAFDAGSVKFEDFISYSFAVLMIFGVLVAFIKNKHVRVNMFSVFDVSFYRQLAGVLSAIPFIVIVFLSVPAISFSWSIFEGSREPHGLGGLFIVKTLLPISFGFIAVFLCFGRKDHS